MTKANPTSYRVRMLFCKWHLQLFAGDNLVSFTEHNSFVAAHEAGKATGLPDREANAKGDRP